jgi:hypothetical protein
MGYNGRNPGPCATSREEIWKWITANPEKKAAYVVGMAPKDFEPEAWQRSLIRELLCRFGDSGAVQSAVHANFFTGRWIGPASLYYTTEKDALVQMGASESILTHCGASTRPLRQPTPISIWRKSKKKHGVPKVAQ